MVLVPLHQTLMQRLPATLLGGCIFEVLSEISCAPTRALISLRSSLVRHYLLLAGLLVQSVRLCAQAPQRFFFGNLHSHTAYSDGSKDSATTGVNTPREAYFFAQASQHFDFLGISEHNHTQAGMRLPRYAKGLQQADSATVNGEFVALWGMEWGIIAGGGHLLIYGYDNLIGWEAGSYDEFIAQRDYRGLWRKINARPGAFASCAHPDNSDYNNLRTGAFDDAADSALVGSAFRSGPAFSTDIAYSDPSSSSYEAYYRALLTRGYHVGPFYDHDNHNTTFGRTTEGRLVALADTLTKSALLSAFRERHFYASDDWNTEVSLNLTADTLTYIMGSIVQHPPTPTIALTITDGDAEPVRSISLLRGVSGSGQQPVSVATGAAGSSAVQYTDAALAPGDSAYYYAVIIQQDNDRIITAPIWYRRGPSRITGLTSVAAHIVPVTIWPNPVAMGADATIAAPTGATIFVLDPLGRVVWNTVSTEVGSTLVPTQTLSSGLYIVQVVVPGQGVTTRRLVVD